MSYRVWAPKACRVEVELYENGVVRHEPLSHEGNGVYAGFVSGIGAGTRYKFRLDGGASWPDPWSRSQPDGVHEPSAVVDPADYQWRDADWQGVPPENLVVYELHVGTFTPEGTYAAVTEQVPELVRLGVTAVELMPLAEFAGRHNWGYDGVYPFAPTAAYGSRNDLKRLVDAAHQSGLAVLLDVVYNHFGPSGNYSGLYSDDYITDRYNTPWGGAVNYDGPNSRFVRELAIQNAAYWIREFHFDGLRLDATHAIYDETDPHILHEIAVAARAAAPHRRVVVIAENEQNDVRLLAPIERGGIGLDGVWADDFHHTMRTFLTGERDGYYADYSGRLEDVARVIREGFLYQGQTSQVLGHRRGTKVTDEPAYQFVFCLENHDQVGNRAFGERLEALVDLDRFLVASAVLLLAPETPLIWMGQEFAASSPFQFFTDHDPELGALVTEGRRDEFSGFRIFQDPEQLSRIPDPQAPETFMRSKLDLGERERHTGCYRLYQDLLRLRRQDPVFGSRERRLTAAAAITDQILALHRWVGDQHRLLLANFGSEAELRLESVSSWRGALGATAAQQLWSSLEYSGRSAQASGAASADRFVLPERSALVLTAVEPEQ